MRSRTIAVVSSIAALSFVAAPAAAIAASASHSPDRSAQLDRSRDARGVNHVDKTPDRHSADNSRDKRDR